jgi:hypothetical protein
MLSSNPSGSTGPQVPTQGEAASSHNDPAYHDRVRQAIDKPPGSA